MQVIILILLTITFHYLAWTLQLQINTVRVRYFNCLRYCKLFVEIVYNIYLEYTHKHIFIIYLYLSKTQVQSPGCRPSLPVDAHFVHLFLFSTTMNTHGEGQYGLPSPLTPHLRWHSAKLCREYKCMQGGKGQCVNKAKKECHFLGKKITYFYGFQEAHTTDFWTTLLFYKML